MEYCPKCGLYSLEAYTDGWHCTNCGLFIPHGSTACNNDYNYNPYVIEECWSVAD